MTDEEILKLAIEKAIRNGWNNAKSILLELNSVWREVCCDCGDCAITVEAEGGLIYYHSDKEIIFDPDFAQAFWGKIHVCGLTGVKIKYDKLSIGDLSVDYPETDCDCVANAEANRCDKILEIWQYHLQQMVIEKEPLKYLEKFL